MSRDIEVGDLCFFFDASVGASWVYAKKATRVDKTWHDVHTHRVIKSPDRKLLDIGAHCVVVDELDIRNRRRVFIVLYRGEFWSIYRWNLQLVTDEKKND